MKVRPEPPVSPADGTCASVADEIRLAETVTLTHPRGVRISHVDGWLRPATLGCAAQDSDLLRDARILIVDDCALYRECLAAIFALEVRVPPSVAWDLRSLICALEDNAPTVILLNIETRDSVVLLRQALDVSPNARVIVLGISEDDEAAIVSCAEAGVAGFHLRTESLDSLLVSTRRVAAGESLVSPRVTGMLLRRLSALAAQRQPVANETVLTPREVRILRMLELGLSNRDIANRLYIAVHTVKNHVHSLLTKLGVSTRAEAAALCRNVQYTEVGDSLGARSIFAPDAALASPRCACADPPACPRCSSEPTFGRQGVA